MAITITMPNLSLEFPAVLFRKHYETLTKTGGIYFLYDKDELLLYVGQTKNFYNRLSHHLAGRDNSRWFYDQIHTIRLYYVDEPYEREVYETFAINEYKPAYNSSKVFGKSKSSSEIIAEERINSLRDERRSLVSENIDIQEYFDDLVAYSEDDLDFEDLSEWGTLLHNRRRISEIEREIRVIKKQKHS